MSTVNLDRLDWLHARAGGANPRNGWGAAVASIHDGNLWAAAIHRDYPAIVAELRNLRAQHDRLVADLREYGGHVGLCTVDEPCSCGWDAILRALNAPTTQGGGT